MARQDLLNASDFLDSGQATQSEDESFEPVIGEDGVVDYTKFDEDANNSSDVGNYLPDSLYFGGIDTGIPLNKQWSAGIVGVGDGMLDLWDGVSQILGTEEMKNTLREEQAHMNELYNDPRFGTTARVGQMGGFLVDPIGMIVPIGKGKNLWSIAKTGAAMGAGYGAFGYVDEEAGQTRTGNALFGAVTGGVMSPALFAGARGIKGLGGEIQERSATALLNTYKKQYLKFMASGATPANARKFASQQLNMSAQDRARLIIASRKPFNLDTPPLLTRPNGAYVKKGGVPVYDTGKAQRNLDAMQSRSITNGVNTFLEKSSIGRDVKQVGGDALDAVYRAITPTITRISKIDSTIGLDLMSMEGRSKQGTFKLHAKVFGFNKAIRGMEIDTQDALRAALQRGDRSLARGIFLRNGGKVKEFDDMLDVVSLLYREAKGSGYDIPEIANFFPRRVKDMDGLASVQDSHLSQAIKDFISKKKREPSDKEMNRMIDNILNTNNGGRLQTGGSLRKRSKEVLLDEELKYYHDTEATLTSYINDMVADIERAKFFRKIGVKKKNFETDGSDVTDILNDVIRNGRNKGRYGEGQVRELTDLLRSRFTVGELAPKASVQAFKNMGYIATLGNFKSAMTQFGDLAFSAHRNGIINTSLEIMNRVPLLKRIIKDSHNKVTKEQLGLEEAIQEFAGDRNGKKALDWILGATGFKSIDKFGKETFINAHIRQVKKALNNKKTSEATKAELSKKWRTVFGNETDQMIDDLSKGKFTDNVAVYLFNQLEEVQPIALSSMPQPYLNNPNGRIFYMLKSFTIKQLDLMRRDILDNFAKGNAPLAFKNLTSLGTLFVLGNGSADMLKDFMSGKEIEMEDTLVDNIWKLLGTNRYTVDNFDGKPVSSIYDMIAPPVSAFDRVVRSMGDFSKTYEVSPFNGTQKAWKTVFGDGTLTRTDANQYQHDLSMLHEGLDRD